MHNVHRGREKREERRIPRSEPAEEEQDDILGATATDAQSVDLNHATALQLASIEGVEAVLANTIVEHRVSHGHYTGWDELAALPGMSDVALHQIQRAARLGGQADANGKLSHHH